MSTLYLNNDGSRWIFTDPKLMSVVVKYPDGSTRIRKVDFWGSWGNFAYCRIRFRGYGFDFVPSDKDEETGLPLLEITQAMWEHKQAMRVRSDEEAQTCGSC